MKRKFGNSVSHPLKINIGCGNTGLDDWVNIDKSPLGRIANHKTLKNIIFKCKILPKKYDLKLPNNYLVHDTRKGLPFEDNSIGVIYSSHFFEHLTYFEARDLIKECYRVDFSRCNYSNYSSRCRIIGSQIYRKRQGV